MNDVQDIMPDARPVRAPRVAFREIDGETVIVQPVEGMTNVLNGSGSLVWRLADGAHTVSSIAAELANQYEATHEEAMADVVSLLTELRGHGLVSLVP